jgi:hypothetical protein
VEFTHVVLQEVVGLTVRVERDLVLVDQGGLRACLTGDPEPRCADADLSTAIGNMLLRRLSGGGPEGTPEERLTQEVEIARGHRQQLGRGRTYLVVHRTGTVPDFPDREREGEIGDVVVRLNGGGARSEVIAETKKAIAALMLSVSTETAHSTTLKPYATALWYSRGDGKRVFAKQMGASASATAWKTFPEGGEAAVEETFREFSALRDLDRVFNLFLASLENAHDRLRAFQSGWAALEIFVNKVFGHYEGHFFDGLVDDAGATAHASYVARIRGVMKDKYRLADKFALVASSLAPGEADADLDAFREAKAKRDDLAHGQDVSEIELPVELVQALLKRYVHLHAQAHGAET